jgi:hypothetical protein
MSESIGNFPSGQPIRKVTQTDRSPKRVFVLGVYASAVHARWIGEDGKTRIAALAVASEPEIFWTGAGSEQLIATITPPNTIGTLKSAGQNLNGPSGRALDEHILAPLGLTRKDAWLCDLVPHSCMNPGQEAALKREGMPVPEWPKVPKCLADAARLAKLGLIADSPSNRAGQGNRPPGSRHSRAQARRPVFLTDRRPPDDKIPF